MTLTVFYQTGWRKENQANLQSIDDMCPGV